MMPFIDAVLVSQQEAVSELAMALRQVVVDRHPHFDLNGKVVRDEVKPEHVAKYLRAAMVDTKFATHVGDGSFETWLDYSEYFDRSLKENVPTHLRRWEKMDPEVIAAALLRAARAVKTLADRDQQLKDLFQ